MSRKIFFLFFVTLCLSACVSLPEPEGFLYQEIQSEKFTVATWARIGKAGSPLRVYIEGDGLAWINEYTPSSDPTPSDLTVLKMAQRDPSANVVYLARPCQYVTSPNCDMYYWTMGRFAPEIIDAETQAVRRLIAQYQAPKVELVGFSGGAAVALLSALNLPEVSKIYTVAGVLDHKRWTSFHGDTPLSASLNPGDYKDRLAKIPQKHFVGGKDKIVPPSLVEEFVHSFKDAQVEMMVIPEASHNKKWVDIWPRLIAPLN